MRFPQRLKRVRLAIKRVARDRAGASAVEFAIVAGVFLTLVFGMIIYGSYFASQLLVTHIAQEAARASLAGLDDAERTSLANARADELVASNSGLISEDLLTVTAGPDGGGAGVFVVTVTYENDLLGLAHLSTFVPLPPTTQTAAAKVSNGGY